MGKSTSSLILCLFSALMFISCAKENLDEELRAVDHVAKSSVNYTYSEIETAILEQVNNYRTSKDLNKLESIGEISLEAADHNYYMLETGKVSHDNFGARYNALVSGVGAKAVSENVGYGYRTAEAVVKAWIASEGHRKNIESNHSHFGVSVVQDENGRNYFTNIFVRK